MAHVGKIFPIKQEWRLYSGEAGSLAGYPPARIRLRTQNWQTAYDQPPVNTWIDADPMDWDPGDDQIGYQSAGMTTSTAHVLTVGAIGKLFDGLMIWKYACWDDGVDQIPWGWLDHSSHFAWSGDVELILITAPAGATFSPHGTTEIEGIKWPP